MTNMSTWNFFCFQCYTHQNLGWKVHIYDQLPTEEIPDVECPEFNYTTTVEPTDTTTPTTPGPTTTPYPRTYHGNLLQTGWGSGSSLEGDIYIVDKNRFQVIGFSFNSSEFGR